MKKHLIAIWKLIAFICILIFVLTFVIEVLHHPDEETVLMLEIIDYGALTILLLDLVFHFYFAKRKDKFVQRHWLVIFSFLPFGSIFHFFQSLHLLSPFIKVGSKFLHIFSHSEKVTAFVEEVKKRFNKLFRRKNS